MTQNVQSFSSGGFSTNMFAPSLLRGRPADSGSVSAKNGRLRVSQADRLLEREADRIADRVMQANGRGDAARMASRVGPTFTQRKCASCDGSNVSAKDRVDAAVREAGRPLDTRTRTFMEGRFGADFASVRIHADASAGASARAIRARAYTVGSHIVFAPGQYAPGTARGRHLLAHELAHVVQQSAVAPSASGVWVQREPDEEENNARPTEAPPPEVANQDRQGPVADVPAPNCDNLQWTPFIGVSEETGILPVGGTNLASDGALFMPSFNQLRIGVVKTDRSNFELKLPKALFVGNPSFVLTPGNPVVVVSQRVNGKSSGELTLTSLSSGRRFKLTIVVCPVGEH